MTSQNRRSWAAVAIASTLAVGAASPAGAVIAIIKNERALFGPFGVARGEVVRVNVTALGGPDTMPTDVTVSFFNARGAVLKEHRMRVVPGETAFVDLVIPATGGVADPAARFRRPTRAEVAGFNPQPDPPGFMATVEVFSPLTGLSHVFIGDPGIVPEH